MINRKKGLLEPRHHYLLPLLLKMAASGGATPGGCPTYSAPAGNNVECNFTMSYTPPPGNNVILDFCNG